MSKKPEESRLLYLNEPPFADLKVDINGKKFLFNSSILALHSKLIFDFIKENPGKELYLSPPGVDEQYLLDFLHSFFTRLPLKESCSNAVLQPIPYLMICEYLGVSDAYLKDLQDYLEAYIGRIFTEFMNSYCLPYTEFTPEMAEVFKFIQNPVIVDIFGNVINKVNSANSISKTAARVHYLAKIHENFVEYKWVWRSMLTFDFPREFLQKLNLPDIQSFIFESPQFLRPLNETHIRLRATHKHQGQEIVPLNEKDRDFLKYIGSVSDVPIVFTFE